MPTIPINIKRTLEEVKDRGMTCEYWRPFEIRFDKVTGEDEYAELKKKHGEKAGENPREGMNLIRRKQEGQPPIV